jgi:hypothetical protein
MHYLYLRTLILDINAALMSVDIYTIHQCSSTVLIFVDTYIYLVYTSAVLINVDTYLLHISAVHTNISVDTHFLHIRYSADFRLTAVRIHTKKAGKHYLACTRLKCRL